MKTIIKFTIAFILLTLLFTGLLIYDKHTIKKVCNEFTEDEFNIWWPTQSDEVNISQSYYCNYM